MYTTSVKQTNLNMTALRRSWRALVLLPLRRYRRPLCNPRVVGGVREGVSWMAIASFDHQLGGGVAKGAPQSPMGWPPSGPCLWSSQARWDEPPSGCSLWSSRSTQDGPPPVGRASASTNAAATNASPAHCADSWKSSIIICCCSCVGWVPTGGAPASYVPPISSVVSRNKSSN
jgi:hypothetical protein